VSSWARVQAGKLDLVKAADIGKRLLIGQTGRQAYSRLGRVSNLKLNVAKSRI